MKLPPLRTDGTALVDEHGRQRVLHGVNWAATEPAPGQYDDRHLGWLAEQLDMLHEAGFSVILDGHQDLYSQSFGDGAPAWAPLTEQAFEPTELWSDAYLSSPAVHGALDAFWADEPGPDGDGIRTRIVQMWGMLAERFGSHPAVVGDDVLNEPTPGSGAAELLGGILTASGSRRSGRRSCWSTAPVDSCGVRGRACWWTRERASTGCRWPDMGTASREARRARGGADGG